MGKLHIAVGDMDNYFLNLGVYRMETFLESTKEPGKGPYYAGTVEYGRPLKPHGWQPWTNQELLQDHDGAGRAERDEAVSAFRQGQQRGHLRRATTRVLGSYYGSDNYCLSYTTTLRTF